MNIHEMHSTFRVLGQQMGMQLMRGILPESIDIYINNIINEDVHTNLLLGVRTAIQESVNTQASTMSPINNFRTLYRSARYYVNTKEFNKLDPSDKNIIKNYINTNGYHIFRLPTITSNVSVVKPEYLIKPMMYLGFSVEYDDNSQGNSTACRLIGSDVLETTLRDFCNGASKDSPIASLSSIPTISDENKEIDSPNGDNEQLEIYTNSKDCAIQYLNIKYIKSPNVVKWDTAIEKCVNCDLPAYTHYGIVERAVQKFLISVGAVSNNPQKQQTN